MADFDTLESGVEGSRPVELYIITIGTEIFRYTSAEDLITSGSQDYDPEAIKRSTIAQGPNDRNKIVEIALPASNPFAAKYIDIVPGIKASVTIIRLQRDETPTPVQKTIFYGFVRSVRFPGAGVTAVLGLKSLEASSERSVPKFTYQALCNHLLYDSNCTVDPNLFKFTGLVTAQSGNTITVAGAGGFAAGYFNAGFVRPSSDFRLILGHSGDVLTLLLPFPGSIVGSTVDIFAGCNHAITTDCAVKFANVQNHGGFPFIPLRNPFNSKLA